jgi:hypothetical protein
MSMAPVCTLVQYKARRILHSPAGGGGVPERAHRRCRCCGISRCGHFGVPCVKERALVRPLISPALDRLRKDAALAETRHRENTKGEEPPLLEGDIFTSLLNDVVTETCGET